MSNKREEAIAKSRTVAPQTSGGGRTQRSASCSRSVDLSEVERQQEDFGQKLPDKEIK